MIADLIWRLFQVFLVADMLLLTDLVHRLRARRVVRAYYRSRWAIEESLGGDRDAALAQPTPAAPTPPSRVAGVPSVAGSGYPHGPEPAVDPRVHGDG